MSATRNITIAELLDTGKKKWHVFDVGARKIYKDLFVQCYCCVMGTDTMTYRTLSKSKIGVELTAYEYAELSAMFQWHKENIKKDMENMLHTLLISYCAKHDIDSHVERPESAPRKSMTREEFNRLMAAMAMQENLNNNYYRKQLEL